MASMPNIAHEATAAQLQYDREWSTSIARAVVCIHMLMQVEQDGGGRSSRDPTGVQQATADDANSAQLRLQRRASIDVVLTFVARRIQVKLHLELWHEETSARL